MNLKHDCLATLASDWVTDYSVNTVILKAGLPVTLVQGNQSVCTVKLPDGTEYLIATENLS